MIEATAAMHIHSKQCLDAWSTGWISLLLAAATTFGLVAGMKSTLTAADAETAAQLRIAAKRILPLHRSKSPSGPDDWLATHHEPGQTFEQYRHSNPNRPTKERTILYIECGPEIVNMRHSLVRAA